MLFNICEDPKEPHTLWWWVDDPNDHVPAPYSRQFDNLQDAENAIRDIPLRYLKQIAWMKLFRSDNESYTCGWWDNPSPSPIEKEAPKHYFIPYHLSWFMPRCKVCRKFPENPVHRAR
jgi:hypothetical protein